MTCLSDDVNTPRQNQLDSVANFAGQKYVRHTLNQTLFVFKKNMFCI